LRALKHDSNQWSSWVEQCRIREVKRDEQIGVMAQEKNELVNPVFLCAEIEKVQFDLDLFFDFDCYDLFES
jgi:hypothetical protein